MSIAAIWDRFWWSMLITIGSGLLWLKFIDPYIPCFSIGLIFCTAAGLVYFVRGIRAMKLHQKMELQIEKAAYEELMTENQEEFKA